MRLAPFTLVALIALGASGCEGRPRSAKTSVKSSPRTGPAIAVFDISGGVPEREEAGLFGPPPGRRRAFDSLVKAIAEARRDKEIKGLFVRFGEVSLGMARAQELGEVLAGARESMPVFCHADGLGNATLLVAARGCTKVYLVPSGQVEAVGLAAQVIYMHRLLADTLHLDLDILQIGKFKGAEEPLTRDGPSPEARESLENVLVDLRGAWLDGIAKGRPRAGVGDAAEDGPFSARAALAHGLVDAIGYLDEAKDAAKAACGAVREATEYGSGSSASGPEIDDLLRLFAGSDDTTPQVMVLRAIGSISMDGSGIFGGEEGITEKAMSRRVRQLADDDAVKAVVLRIDSPGGSALASDLLWHELMKLRAKKPIVVSVGDMAASGGYYLASTGNEIFAEPTSIVGSIGVVGGKVGLGDALEHVGVHVETFPAKKGDDAAKARAGYESPFVAWDDATRERVRDSMIGIYDLFLQRVSEGRKVPVDQIAVSAEGRIFSGIEGNKRGLVDTIGGLAAAIARAKELGKLPSDALVRVFPSTPRFVDVLTGGEGVESETPPVDLSKADSSRLAVHPLGRWLHETAPELEVYAQTLSLLATRDRVVCTLPFALVVR